MIIVIFIAVFFIFLYFSYSFFNGNPLSKYLFKKIVQEYLELKYNEDFTVTVRYSFKLSTRKQAYYYAIVKGNASKLPEFKAYRDAANNKVSDNLYWELWNEQITIGIKNILDKHYDNENFMIENYIPNAPSSEKIAISDIPTYEEYAISVPQNKRTDIIISIHSNSEIVDSATIYSIIKDIVDNRIYFNQLRFDFMKNNFEVESSIGLKWDEAVNMDNLSVQGRNK